MFGYDRCSRVCAIAADSGVVKADVDNEHAGEPYLDEPASCGVPAWYMDPLDIRYDH